jgi:maltose/moltooligosaccharide transporter
MEKRKLSFWEIWNMSFGFLGIQFGFALQGGFMSRIFQTLGADVDSIPGLWIAAPLTGLLVQPIVGYLSDNTWSPRYGRRKPFFLIGAIFASITLLFMPHSPTLWIAAGLLWILDSTINISMEPFRALVADKLPESQRSNGFVIQTLIIGIGTWVASNLPWLITKLGVSNEAAAGVIPQSVVVAFSVGAFVFLLSVLFTIFKTREDPPEDLEKFQAEKKESSFIPDLMASLKEMPSTMKKLGLIQFFSWFAFFTMWSLSTPALTEHVFNAPKPNSKEYLKLDANGETIKNSTNEIMFLSQEKEKEYSEKDKTYNDAADLVGSATGIYGLSSMAFALLLTFYTAKKRINRKYIHMASLFLGGAGFIYMFYASPSTLFFSFILIGLAWGSILSMPYAMLSSSVNPKKMGMMMGLFNMFIVIPQIIAALGGINYLYKLIGTEHINAMLLAGISLIIAGLCNLFITDKNAISG